jgi:hypothetical protein
MEARMSKRMPVATQEVRVGRGGSTGQAHAQLYGESMEDLKRHVQGEQRKNHMCGEDNYCDHSEEPPQVITEEYLIGT